VIPEEFETSIEILARVLAVSLVPMDTTEAFAREAHAGLYEPLRSAAPPTSATLHEVVRRLPEQEIVVLRLVPGSSAEGRSLTDLDLRRALGVSVLAVLRGDESHPNPSGEFVFAPDDRLIVFGPPGPLRETARLLAPGGEGLT
jgi:CPA2 family monovalent cation:H+ antiporter-2